MFNKRKIEDLNAKIIELESINLALSKYGGMDAVQIEKRIEDLNQKSIELDAELLQVEKKLFEEKQALIETQEIAMLQEVGIYQYSSILESAVAYADKIKTIQIQIREANKIGGGAINSAQGWTVNGSASEGAKMFKEFSKLMLRAYNGEVDDAIRTLKPFKVQSVIDRLNKVEQSIEKLGKTMSITINDSYHQIRIDEIKLNADFLEKKEEEKEKQREEKLRLKEEEKAQRQFEVEKAKLEKELSHHRAVAQKAEETGNTTAAAEAKLKIAEVENSMSGIEERAANIRTGYVYVISNIGSFGEEVLKVGLTRRLDPEERIQELSDASVPFKFDIHAMIFSSDAVTLEKRLHQELAMVRINKVNARKEFFKATPALVKEILMKVSSDQMLVYQESAEASEWRISNK